MKSEERAAARKVNKKVHLSRLMERKMDIRQLDYDEYKWPCMRPRVLLQGDILL